MMRAVHYLLVVALFFCCCVVASAATQQQAGATTAVQPARDTSPYGIDPQPLTLQQCGQCHTKHFFDLKNSGGRHKFDCRDCHTVFHAYNPRKNNFTELMPKCVDCHTQLHGEKHIQCLTCHENPHAAQQPPAIARVENFCSDCHVPQAGQLAAYPSRHTELSCSYCHHTEHGQIPTCAECHQPHFEAQPFERCTSCHAVHQPLQIALGDDVELKTCDSCHSDIYQKWQGTPSKHGQVRCSTCHSAHRQVPQCLDCHTPPPSHGKQLLERFPVCLDCHLDVHDLPVKKK